MIGPRRRNGAAPSSPASTAIAGGADASAAAGSTLAIGISGGFGDSGFGANFGVLSHAGSAANVTTKDAASVTRRRERMTRLYDAAALARPKISLPPRRVRQRPLNSGLRF